MRYYLIKNSTGMPLMAYNSQPEIFLSEKDVRDYFGEDRAADYTLHEYPMSDWVQRERNNISDGIYIMPIWQEMDWYQKRYHSMTTFCHVDRDDPELVHIFENDKKGEREITTPMKPGRFLKKYFGDVLDEQKIKEIVDIHREAFMDRKEVKFAKTPDEIEAVYTMDCSFNSCMQRPASTWDDDTGGIPHPTRAYGAGDLEVAYITEGPRLKARALVWREKNKVGRVYGDAAALRAALANAGIVTTSNSEKYDTFGGARLLYIPHTLPEEELENFKSDYPEYPEDHLDKYPAVVLPYIDGYQRDLLRDGEYLVLTERVYTESTLAYTGTIGQYYASHQDGVHMSRCQCETCLGWSTGNAAIVTKWENPWSRSPYYIDYDNREMDSRCETCVNTQGFYDGNTGYFMVKSFDRLQFGVGRLENQNMVERAVITMNPTKPYAKSDVTELYYFENDLVTIADGKRMSHNERLLLTRQCRWDGKHYMLEDMVRVSPLEWVRAAHLEDYEADLMKDKAQVYDIFGPSMSERLTVKTDWLKELLDTMIVSNMNEANNEAIAA